MVVTQYTSCYICCRFVTFDASRKKSNVLTFNVNLLHLMPIVTFVRYVTFVVLNWFEDIFSACNYIKMVLVIDNKKCHDCFNNAETNIFS